MDICSYIELSATDNINDLHGLRSTHGAPKVLAVDDLSHDVAKFLNIHDAREEDSSSSRTDISFEFQKKGKYDRPLQSIIMTQAPEKCLIKRATFPCSSKPSSPQDAITNELSTHGDNVKSLDSSAFRSTSIPTHLKPVSALKGSREKRGVAPPMKLTVKWAPDVYDPIPTSVSHLVTNNRSSKHSRKNSRNKQKNGSKSSRGSKGKDKKQVRKRGGSSSSMGFKLHDHEDEVVDFHEHVPKPGGIDFHVGNPDQLCGSSFLKRYGASLHLSSVAEAT